VIFGGVGAGLYGILLYCILAVFIAGLMVGRTPEYLGKKIEQKEVKMAMLAVIATGASILVFTALSSVIQFPAKGYWNPPGRGTLTSRFSQIRGSTWKDFQWIAGRKRVRERFAVIGRDVEFRVFSLLSPVVSITVGRKCRRPTCIDRRSNAYARQMSCPKICEQLGQKRGMIMVIEKICPFTHVICLKWPLSVMRIGSERSIRLLPRFDRS
jgi:hypothetical protein